jgi:flagellar hook-basal body complex protein FliE
MEIKGLSIADRLKMLEGIKPIQGLSQQSPIQEVSGGNNKESFMAFLADSISKTNATGVAAEREMQNAIEGKEAYPHSAIIALQKADISFQLLMTVQRNLTQAYQEIMRTPIG